MPARYLLDTNICIYIIRYKPAEVRARFERLQAGEAALSVVTFGELHYGAAKSQHRDTTLAALEELSAFLPVLDLPQAAAADYGRLRAALESKGKVIGNNDMWIAAHALTANLTLVTNNEREFRRIPDLALDNWVKH